MMRSARSLAVRSRARKYKISILPGCTIAGTQTAHCSRFSGSHRFDKSKTLELRRLAINAPNRRHPVDTNADDGQHRCRVIYCNYHLVTAAICVSLTETTKTQHGRQVTADSKSLLYSRYNSYPQQNGKDNTVPRIRTGTGRDTTSSGPPAPPRNHKRCHKLSTRVRARFDTSVQTRPSGS